MWEEKDGRKSIQLEIIFNNQCRERDKIQRWTGDMLHCTCTAAVGIVL